MTKKKLWSTADVIDANTTACRNKALIEAATIADVIATRCEIDALKRRPPIPREELITKGETAREIARQICALVK